MAKPNLISLNNKVNAYVDDGGSTGTSKTTTAVKPVSQLYVDTLLNSIKNSSKPASTTQQTGTPAYSSVMQTVKQNAAGSAFSDIKNTATQQTSVPSVLNPSTYSGTSQPTVSVTPAGTTQVATPAVNTAASSSASTPVTSTSEYQALLSTLYEQQQARAREQQALLEQQAQSAYNSNMASLANAYKTRNDALLANYNSALDSLLGSYNQSKDSLGQSAEDALREAYVNRMMSERNLGQQLSAQGLSGGASESAIANLINQYGSNRNVIERELGSNLASLENVYNQNRNSALQAYNDALAQSDADRANYEMQLNNDLAENKANSYADLYSSLTNLDNNYLSNIADLLASQQTYSQNLSLAQAQAEAALAEEAAAEAQASVANGNWLTGYAQAELNRGVPVNNIAAYLANYGATPEEITAILNTIGA